MRANFERIGVSLWAGDQEYRLFSSPFSPIHCPFFLLHFIGVGSGGRLMFSVSDPPPPPPHHHHRHHHHRRHQYLDREGRWSTTDDFATSFLHFFVFSTAVWDLPNSRPVHSLMSSSHLFLCLPCLLPPFTVPCEMVLAKPDERET